MSRRDYSTAAQAFQACAESSHREATVRLARFHLAECHTQLALAAWRRGESEQAWEQIEAGIATSQPTAERHLIAAQMARRLGDNASARHHVEAALARLPDHEPSLALAALQHYEEGRTDEALAKAETLPSVDGRLRRFHEAHAKGDRTTAASHLAAVAAGYPDSLL